MSILNLLRWCVKCTGCHTNIYIFRFHVRYAHIKNKNCFICTILYKYFYILQEKREKQRNSWFATRKYLLCDFSLNTRSTCTVLNLFYVIYFKN